MKQRRQAGAWIASLAVSVAFGLWLMACGSYRTEKETSARISPSSGSAGALGRTVPLSKEGYVEGDEDNDGDPYKDKDDHLIRAYGHLAGIGEKIAAEAVVKRYFVAAVAQDGARACAMLPRAINHGAGLLRALPPEYAPAPGSTVLQGKDCAQIMGLLFGLDRERLSAEIGSLRITRLRVDGGRGLAFLGFTTTPERMIPLVRQGSKWRMGALLDQELL